MSKKWPNGTPIKKTVKTVEGTQTAFFYPTGNVWREEYRNRAGELHRAGAPAIVAWHPNNQVWLHKYYRHGNLHRESGPAIVEYDEQGNLEHLEYYTHGSPVAPPPQ
ncbi:hypothetical protein HMPREF0578_1874 [Mobiluncus mulieris 28-1]|uniref:MORN repeat variant n=1 Tax=Mobiluncus mulieris TaxID=2052 RepID=A0A7Y0YJ29_9ACTO|nr:hypothetical protein [Mobiluncus mulieris]EEZ90873.1 hypothetical protein HMPREF0578_1874 [Mobiluncus mulieris 28-1]MBB5845766.1 hypothetical protein [Mobiluncus mulieris]MCU9971139.1 hypothetical protein [Mobiluncus mulieris]MCU9975601.1 hypothetical protein [Mobiluncus mulieris]MCU9994929.1 hypothetical protein [Mobiluncus mulieris]